MASELEKTAVDWLTTHKEDHTDSKADMNQYWYSAATIATLVDVVRSHCLPAKQPDASLDVAFISTPSLYFSLSRAERAQSRLLEYDDALGVDEPGFVFYDFHEPEALPEELRGAFGCVVIDPPYITSEVWMQYVATAKWLLAPGGHAVLTTVIENAELLGEQLGVQPNHYLPSIPNLPYQYAVYTNFDAPQLAQTNPEVPHDPVAFLSAPREAARAAVTETPLAGKGASYDFEAMIEAELRRHAAAAQQA